ETGSATPSPSPEETEEAEEAEEAEEPETSDRGNLVKDVGEPAGIFNTNDRSTNVIDFTVTSIAPAKCTEEYAQPPINGHYLASIFHGCR
uniref:hypothetical protein n=1 Tax=Arthrobacter sp. CAL618 TaxID=1055770 RepID=UPI000463099D